MGIGSRSREENMSRSGMLVLILWVVAAGTLPAIGADSRALEIHERINAQAAIEGVYWRPRIWPADNTGPTPSRSLGRAGGALRGMVANYLGEAKALEQIWGRPSQGADLQAEIERMVRSSTAPGVLEEIFTALGNNPVLVAECLARPLLADRLIRTAYARDPRYHQQLKTEIERTLARRPTLADLRSQGEYAEAVWVRAGGSPEGDAGRNGVRVVRMNDDRWHRSLSRLQEGFAPSSTPPQADPRVEDLPVGVLGALQ